MTIKELKEVILKLQDDDEIIIQIPSGCCGDMKCLDVDFADTCRQADINPKKVKTEPDYLCIYTKDKLPGYRTCRQVGETYRLDKEFLEKKNKS